MGEYPGPYPRFAGGSITRPGYLKICKALANKHADVPRLQHRSKKYFRWLVSCNQKDSIVYEVMRIFNQSK